MPYGPREGKRRATTNRLGIRELVFFTLPTDWQLPKGERSEFSFFER